MKNSSFSKQLIDLLESFDRDEKKGFRLYLQAKLHNRRPELLELLEYLWDYRSSKADKKARFRTLWEERAGEKAVNWRLMNSDLLRKAEDFLSWKHNNALLSTERRLFLLELLRQRGLPQRVAANQRKLAGHLAALADGVAKRRIEYRVKWTTARHSLRARKLGATEANDVLKLHQRVCILESLQLACEVLANRTINQGELKQGMLPMYLQFVEQGELLDEDSLIALYYYCYRTLEDVDNEPAFKQLLNRLDDLTVLTKSEAADILQVAINACIRRVNGGQTNFSEVALDLYETGLEKAYLLDAQGYVSRILFSNFVALALKSGNHQRASDFVDRFAELLAPDVAQSTEALNRARLAYAAGRLSVAMDQLQTTQDEDLLTTLNIKILQMRLYYELDESRLLDAHLDALNTFLRRRKNSLGYHYAAYRNLVGYVGHFRRLNPHDKTALLKFHAKVKQEKQLPEREWLLRVSTSR